MANDKKNGKSSPDSINGESDLEGKMIIDSRGEEIGICKSVSIGDDGQIGLSFEVEINEKKVIPSQTIPYNAISKITDVIELKIPINIKVAKSIDEVKASEEKVGKEKEKEEKSEEKEGKEEKKEKKKEEEEKEEEEEAKAETIKITKKEIAKAEKEEEEEEEEKEKKVKGNKKAKEINEELPVPAEKITGKVETPQADAAAQLSKALKDEEKEEKSEVKEKDVKQLTNGLEESIRKLQKLFNLLSNGEPEMKIEAIAALANLTRISPELGLSLLPKMMKLNEEPQQEVRLAVAQKLEIISETKPELFKGYFLELLENAYEEPIEEIRDQLVKSLHDIALKIPEIASEGLEKFLEDVIKGNKVPEVPAKVIHDTTLKVVSGNFPLTRISIKVKLKFVEKGGKLGTRTAEELEDYNASLIGLTIIEAYTPKQAEKIVKSANFKKLGPVFVEVIQHMIEAYKEGSFTLLGEVVDKKIEIPQTVFERFYKIKIAKTLEGAKNIPLEVFLENDLIEADEAEQIIYRLVMQKRVNAAITMNNNKTFITALDEEKEEEAEEKKEATKKSSTKSSKTKKNSTTKKSSNTKKSSSGTTKKSSTKSTKKNDE